MVEQDCPSGFGGASTIICDSFHVFKHFELSQLKLCYHYENTPDCEIIFDSTPSKVTFVSSSKNGPPLKTTSFPPAILPELFSIEEIFGVN